MTQDEWLALLARLPEFRSITDVNSLADYLMYLASPSSPRSTPDQLRKAARWTPDQLRKAALLYAEAIVASGAAGEFDEHLATEWEDWNEHAVTVITKRTQWSREFDAEVAGALAADTEPMAAAFWASMWNQTAVYGNQFVGAQVWIERNGWRMDRQDLQFVIDTLAEQGWKVEPVRSQGADTAWVLVFHWLEGDLPHFAFDSSLTLAVARIAKHFRDRGKPAPERVDVWERQLQSGADGPKLLISIEFDDDEKPDEADEG